MKLIGYYHEYGDEDLFRVYFTEDFSSLYYKDDDTEIPWDTSDDEFWNIIEKNIENNDFKKEEVDIVASYGICCNSPWSKDAVHIQPYYRYERKFYQVEKTITVYDSIEVGIIGTGSTEEEALRDLNETEKLIQKNFNKENVRI